MSDLHQEQNDLLSTILSQILVLSGRVTNMEATIAEVRKIAERVTNLEETMEEVRKNAKGANNWGKIATGAATVAPVVAAIAKAMGLY